MGIPNMVLAIRVASQRGGGEVGVWVCVAREPLGDGDTEGDGDDDYSEATEG